MLGFLYYIIFNHNAINIALFKNLIIGKHFALALGRFKYYYTTSH